MSTIKEYRVNKNSEDLVSKFRSKYEEYYLFMKQVHDKFDSFSSDEMTMGADYGLYFALTTILIKDKPKHIIEYGPGFTTLLMHRVLQDQDYTPEIYCYEDRPEWYDILKEHGFDPFNNIELVECKCVKETEDRFYVYYDHDLDKHKDVDFILIDGPGLFVYNGDVKDNINTNLHVMEKRFNRRIMKLIDGRKKTQKFYDIPFEEREI